MRLLLDTGVLAGICHPRRTPSAQSWFLNILQQEPSPTFLVSALADYELRRGLQRAGAVKSLEVYDALARQMQFVPVSSETSRVASGLWQKLYERGENDNRLSDADILMLAQAIEHEATLITTDRLLLGVGSRLGIRVSEPDAIAPP